MGRKAKNNIQKATSVSEPNIRMNFLYQASNLLAYTFTKAEQSDFKVKDKIKSNNKINTANNSNEQIKRKRKRIPLRLKRNRYIEDLNKNIKKDKSFDKNAMDIDGLANELQNKKLKSILNKDYPLLPLSRYYNTTLNVVAQKTVSRM